MNVRRSSWDQLGVSLGFSVVALVYFHWCLMRLSAPSMTPPFTTWLWKCVASPIGFWNSGPQVKIVTTTARPICRVRPEGDGFVCDGCSDWFATRELAINHIIADRLIG